LAQVNQDVEMVDTNNKGDQGSLLQSLKLLLSFTTYREITMNVGMEDKSNKEHKKKLTKVLSTKLSIEDYNRFQWYTNEAYRAGTISKPSASEFLRYIVTYPFNELGL
jgi:hypothetical protein